MDVGGLRRLADAEAVLNEHRRDPWTFPPGVGAWFKNMIEDFVSVNAALRNHFQAQVVDGEPAFLFHVTANFHDLLHVPERALYENARHGWCYSGETLMRVIRELVFSSCRGVPQHLAPNKAMHKYVKGLGYDLMEKLKAL